MGIRLGGRQKGTPNKVTKDVKELARAIFDKDYWTARKKAIAAGTCPPQIEGKLLAYAYGEPKQEHQVNHGITVNIGFIQSAESPRSAVIDVTPTDAVTKAAGNDRHRAGLAMVEAARSED